MHSPPVACKPLSLYETGILKVHTGIKYQEDGTKADLLMKTVMASCENQKDAAA